MISNILNIFWIVVFLSFFYSIKKINLKIYLLLLLHFLSVIIINKFLINIEYFPDQVTYTQYTKSIRLLDLSIRENFYLNLSDGTFVSSVYLALFPIPIISNYIDVALISKSYLILFFLYMYKKKYLSNLSFVYILFFPSFNLYTSLALKESIVIISAVLVFIFFVKKKYLFFSFSFLLTLYIKPKILIPFVLILIFYKIYYFLKKNFKNILYIVILPICFLCFCYIYFLYHGLIYEFLNNTRVAQFNNDRLLGYPNVVSHNNFFSIYFFEALYKIYLSPSFFDISNIFQLFQSIENIFMIGLLLFNFFYVRSCKYHLPLLVFLLIFSMLIGGSVFNIGTLTRYKMELVSIYIICSNFLKVYYKNENSLFN